MAKGPSAIHDYKIMHACCVQLHTFTRGGTKSQTYLVPQNNANVANNKHAKAVNTSIFSLKYSPIYLAQSSALRQVTVLTCVDSGS